MEIGDEVFVERTLAGDTDAYTVLVQRYQDRMARYATHMLGNADDADEALQDTFVRAFRSLARCEDPARFGAWVFRILVNRCHTAGARRGRREKTFVRDPIALLAASEAHPAEQQAWAEEIGLALDQLDEAQREAFLLKHVEELSYEEMADLTGVGVSALKMRVKRACARLRELLQEVHQ